MRLQSLSDTLRASADLIDSAADMPDGAILVWPAAKEFVPKEIWAIVSHDDIDWIAFVPTKFKDMYIGWLETGGSFGRCDIQTHTITHNVVGGTLYEGHHA